MKTKTKKPRTEFETRWDSLRMAIWRMKKTREVGMSPARAKNAPTVKGAVSSRLRMRWEASEDALLAFTDFFRAVPTIAGRTRFAVEHRRKKLRKEARA